MTNYKNKNACRHKLINTNNKQRKYIPSTTMTAFFPLSKTSEILILVESLASVGKGLCSSKYCSPCKTF